MNGLHRGDCLEVMAALPAESVDCVVTDPPYGIAFMQSKWDDLGSDRAFQAFSEAWAREALRLLRPGGYLLAMGATRLYHRTACGIQDAGFEIRDSLAWLYGSGFPKSTNCKGSGRGTALKPAWEPVVLARKPLDGRVRANDEAHGTGYLNIDDARVPLNGDTVPEFDANGWSQMPGDTAALDWGSRRTGRKRGGEKAWKRPLTGKKGYRPDGMAGFSQQMGGEAGNALGRWPANVAHDGSEEVAGALPNGESTSRPRHSGPDETMYGYGGGHPRVTGGHDDAGSAARFFYTAKPSKHEKAIGVPAHVTARHPTCKPLALMQWLVRLACPRGGVVLDPFAGSGTTAIAALLEGRRWIAIEREAEYHAIAAARIEWWAREHARKPGRTVGEILGEAPRPKRPEKGAQALQGALAL